MPSATSTTCSTTPSENIPFRARATIASRRRSERRATATRSSPSSSPSLVVHERRESVVSSRPFSFVGVATSPSVKIDVVSIVVVRRRRGPGRLASPSQPRHVSPRGHALPLPVLVPARVHRRERGVLAPRTSRARAVTRLSPHHKVELAQRAGADPGACPFGRIVRRREPGGSIVRRRSDRRRPPRARRRRRWTTPRRRATTDPTARLFLSPPFSLAPRLFHLLLPSRPLAPRPGDRPRRALLRAAVAVPREEAGDGHVVVGLRSGAVRRSFSRARGRRLARRRPNPSHPMNRRATPSPAGRARRARSSLVPPRRRVQRRGSPRGAGVRSKDPLRAAHRREKLKAEEAIEFSRPPRSRRWLPVGVLLVRIPLGVGAFFVTGRPSRTRLPRRTRRRRPSAPLGWAQSPLNFSPRRELATPRAAGESSDPRARRR